MEYFPNKCNKVCRDSFEFQYRPTKSAFSEILHVLHLISLSHRLVISVSFCIPYKKLIYHADEVVREKAKQFGMGLIAGGKTARAGQTSVILT